MTSGTTIRYENLSVSMVKHRSFVSDLDSKLSWSGLVCWYSTIHNVRTQINNTPVSFDLSSETASLCTYYCSTVKWAFSPLATGLRPSIHFTENIQQLAESNYFCSLTIWNRLKQVARGKRLHVPLLNLWAIQVYFTFFSCNCIWSPNEWDKYIPT